MGKVGNAFIGWGGEAVPYRIAKKLTRMYEKDSDVDYKASRMEIEGTGYLVWNYNDEPPKGKRSGHGWR